MKYWVFQGNQVTGPYDADNLSRLPGFSAEALVCPEGRKGTSMGDWQRAGMLPELAVALVKAAQPAVSVVGAAAAGGTLHGSLPPEPTLKDLAALGSLQEKIASLESALGQLQDGLRRKDSELLELHRELEDKKRGEQELVSKLSALEERLTSVSKMHAGLDEARSIEKTVESSVKGVESTVKSMENTVERQRQTIELLTRDLESLRAEKPQAASPLELEPAPRPLLPPEDAPSSRNRLEAPPPIVLEPADLAAPKDDLREPPMPAAALFNPPMDAPPPPLPLAPEPVPAPAKSKKGMVAAFLAVAVLGGGFAAVRMGLFETREEAPAEDHAPLPAVPEAAQAPAPASDAARADELKRQAVDLVRMWPSGDGVKTVGQRLETEPAQPGLSPWMAEKLAEGLFQVNFYAKRAEPGGQTIYEFQVRPAEKRVSALNRAAKALLEASEPEAARPAAKPRKVKVRPKAKAPAAEPAAAVPAEPKDETLEQISLPEADPRSAEPLREPQAGASRLSAPPKAKKTAKAPADAELLDDLLQP